MIMKISKALQTQTRLRMAIIKCSERSIFDVSSVVEEADEKGLLKVSWTLSTRMQPSVFNELKRSI